MYHLRSRKAQNVKKFNQYFLNAQFVKKQECITPLFHGNYHLTTPYILFDIVDLWLTKTNLEVVKDMQTKQDFV